MNGSKQAAWRHTWIQIEALGVHFLLAAIVAVMFALPGQVLEIYRGAAQNFASNLHFYEFSSLEEKIEIFRELGVAAIGIMIVSLVFWMTARHTVIAAAQSTERAGPDPNGIISRWAPRLFSAVPPAFMALGLLGSRVSESAEATIRPLMEAVFVNQFMAGGDDEEEARELAAEALSSIEPYNDYMYTFAGIALAIAVLMFFIVTLLDQSKSIQRRLQPKVLTKSWASLVFIICLLALIAVFQLFPVVVPQQIGTLGLLCLFLSFLLLAVTQLHTWGRSINTPLVVILIIVAMAFAAFDLNDNHNIREAVVDADSLQPKMDIGEAFNLWYAERDDRDAYQGRRYPIYIIAAQGGGIYAAHHAATFLAGMQDICPNFAHHTFAISGVSGGAVGATVFASLAREEGASSPAKVASTPGRCYGEGEKRPQRYVYAAEEILGGDFLSPLTASFLFPDFLQRFLPFPIEAFDRSRPLEYSLERAYSEGVVESGFAKGSSVTPRDLGGPFIAHWDPKTYKNAPALVLNTTDVHTGERRVVSPFTFDGAGLHFIPIWRDESPGATPQVNLTSSAAAFLSARFPWLTPAGTFYEKRADAAPDEPPVKHRVVDGGYFENSGAATAVDLVTGLVEAAKRNGDEIEVVLLVFSSAGFESTPSNGFGELLSPIRTMIGTQVARAGIEISKAVSVLNSMSTDRVSISARMVKLELQGYGYPLPLGWRLSDVTRHLITYQNGAKVECTSEDLTAAERGDGVSAGCVLKKIHDQLN